MDGSAVGLDIPVFGSRHDGTCSDLEFRHGLAQGGNFALCCFGFGVRLAYLNQYRGTIPTRYDEVDLLTRLRLVEKNLLVESPQRREYEVFQKVSGVDENP